MNDHLYKIGQDISLASGAGILLKPFAIYKIVARLPARDQELQYRVKSEQEPFERVVDEYQITAIPPQPPAVRAATPDGRLGAARVPKERVGRARGTRRSLSQ
ncbi:MAG: hypothetical protein ACHQAY_01975 [Hyphomicrobiales bacterium]